MISIIVILDLESFEATTPAMLHISLSIFNIVLLCRHTINSVLLETEAIITSLGILSL